MTPLERAHHVRERLPAGLFAEQAGRVAAQPFVLDAPRAQLLEKLGLVLHRFNAACNLLYRQSAAGQVHPWVAPLLDAGKPPELVALGRHDKLKGQVAAVIRADLVLTDDGFALVDFHSSSDGLGLTAWLAETYSAWGDEVIGGADGIRRGFESVLQGGDVWISEKSAQYRPEMEWLVGAARVRSVEQYAPTRKPGYRLFATSDYPHLEKFRETWQPGQPLTPPIKPYLEEKLWLALFWSRPLQEFWRREIGEKGQKLLQGVIPYAWVLDPTPLPPHAVVPELNISSWQELERFGPEQRALVLKISDSSSSSPNGAASAVSNEEWTEQLRVGLAEFHLHPRVLQRFVPGAAVLQDYVAEDGAVVALEGAACIRPTYFVVNDRVTLGGVLARLESDSSEVILSPVMVGKPAGAEKR